jgi:hypothetical protein
MLVTLFQATWDYIAEDRQVEVKVLDVCLFVFKFVHYMQSTVQYCMFHLL